MNSLIPGADILEDFHFIPDSKSTTLVYKFGSSTEHSPYDEGLTTMGAGTAIYYFTATGTLGTIYAFAAGDQKAFLKKYNNGTWSNWVALVSNADLSGVIKTKNISVSVTSGQGTYDLLQIGFDGWKCIPVVYNVSNGINWSDVNASIQNNLLIAGIANQGNGTIEIKVFYFPSEWINSL